VTLLVLLLAIERKKCKKPLTFIMINIIALAFLFMLIFMPRSVLAEEKAVESPWLVAPIVSSDPKLGTSAGAMGAYIKKLDEQSPSSMLGVSGSYSDTDSYVTGAFFRGFFDNDRQRIIAAIAHGKIKNDYEDFLGTGYPVSTTDNLNLLVFRYSKRTKENWFFGAQLVSTNYAITANDWLSGEIIDLVGLTGYKSNALGLVALNDSRDNLNSPSAGAAFEFHNLAYRKSLNGDISFDAYSMKYSKYISHGDGHVVAFRVKGRWTNNAPTSGYSSVELRGYTRGQYLAPHMTLVEVEERVKLKGRWGVTISTGLAKLYGGERVRDNDNLYPSLGAGLTFMVKPEEKMILRAEYAVGNSDNSGFYLKFGQAF
jgi:hypothetical protein